MTRRPTVVIVGGGFCGAAAAYHLTRSAGPGSLDIVVIEPRGQLGAGLAYSTLDPAHRINVPAARMTLRTDDAQHFMRWLSRPDGPWMSPGTITRRGDIFPQRNLFGQYVADHLKPHLASGAIRHIQARAIGARAQGGRSRIALSDGTALAADVLVIAISHPLPGLPCELGGVADSEALIRDPYDGDRVSRIDPSAEVLVVGTGLTAADVIASLDRQGHFGRILALSRRGLRSRGHGPNGAASSADFAAGPSLTTRALLRRIRAAVAADAASGLTWHAALDKVRTQGPEIWAALDTPERRRLVERLRPWWDVHRFRVAPQVGEVLERRLKARNLAVAVARLIGAEPEGARLAVSWRPRGGAEVSRRAFDAVVLATGPAHGDLFRTSPLIAALGEAGALRPDALHLGLLTGEDARAIAAPVAGGAPIFVCGPLARGTVGELMGIPEVTAHAERVAREIALWAEHASSRLALASGA